MVLAKLSIRRPVLMTMLIMLFVVLGVFSYTRLPVELTPEVDLPFVTVTTIYPGAGPEEIETQITQKIEDAISNISNIKNMISTSIENASIVGIEFNAEVDVDLAAIDVKDEIDKIRRTLPDGAETPTVVKFDIAAQPIMNLAIFGARSLREVHELADNLIRDELSRIDGVASIEVVGGQKREIQIALERTKLYAYDLSILDVARAIAVENMNVPAGSITQTWREYTVRTVGEFGSIDDLACMPVRLRDGQTIELQELGHVRDTFEEVREMARYNGKNVVGMTIQKQGDANVIQAVAAIHKALAQLADRLPQDVTVNIVRENASFIEQSVRDVIQNIFLGIVLTAILLYLFTHSWQATIIASMSIPASLIATFLLIDFAGFTINVMTLMALSVCIGVLVTNALVVLENIARHIERGENPVDAAEIGASEIAVAVIAATATNVVVFTPIAFMSGIIGQFFRQFGLTVVFATLFSLFVSFSLTPMMSARLLTYQKSSKKGIAAAWDRAYQSLSKDYRSALGWCLLFPKRTLTGVFAIFGFGIFLFGYIGGEFMPQSDQGMISIRVKMPSGTPLEQTDKAVGRIERVLTSVPEIESVYMAIGGGNEGVEEASVLVQLIDASQRKKNVGQIINDLRPRLSAIPDAEIQLSRPGMGGSGGDIVVEITGAELYRLREISEQLQRNMHHIDGLVDIKTSYKPAREELVFIPNRRQMSDLDISTGTVASVLRTSFEGQVASVFREKGKEYNIRVKLAEADRERPSDLALITLSSGDYQVPLDALGHIDTRPGVSEIKRKNKARLIEISANVGQGSQTDLIRQIQEQIDQLSLPPGYRIGFGGSEEMRVEAFAQIFTALILAIVLTYIVLAAIMESYVHPFTIMLTLPLGLIGVAFSLFLGAQTLNIFSLMAMVMLVGIVVNNAILILDYAQQLRKEGRDIRDALLESATTRLRPIAMSNLAIALSMIPQALGGTGAEFRVSMAIVTIGGVLLSAVFTLFVIPVVYVFMDRFAKQPEVGEI